MEEDDDEGEESVDKSENANEPIILAPSEVAQAFSHFSYEATGRKRLICDLQGVFEEERNELHFSGPAIHDYNHRHERRRMVHGRTDRGQKGMAMRCTRVNRRVYILRFLMRHSRKSNAS